MRGRLDLGRRPAASVTKTRSPPTPARSMDRKATRGVRRRATSAPRARRRDGTRGQAGQTPLKTPGRRPCRRTTATPPAPLHKRDASARTGKAARTSPARGLRHCHSSTPPRTGAREDHPARVCFTSTSSAREQTGRPATHPGSKVACSDSHNVHVSSVEARESRLHGRDCYQCHAERRPVRAQPRAVQKTAATATARTSPSSTALKMPSHHCIPATRRTAARCSRYGPGQQPPHADLGRQGGVNITRTRLLDPQQIHVGNNRTRPILPQFMLAERANLHENFNNASHHRTSSPRVLAASASAVPGATPSSSVSIAAPTATGQPGQGALRHVQRHARGHVYGLLDFLYSSAIRSRAWTSIEGRPLLDTREVNFTAKSWGLEDLGRLHELVRTSPYTITPPAGAGTTTPTVVCRPPRSGQNLDLNTTRRP